MTEALPENYWIPVPHGKEEARNTRIIFLTQHQVTLVDAEDYDGLNKYKWHALLDKKMKSYYAVRHGPTNRSKKTKDKRDLLRMHREIMNTPKGMHTDHINHDTLDNRKSNLRIVTPRKNCQNLKYKRILPHGVYLCPKKEYFMAQIKINGKRKYLGLFPDHISGSIFYEAIIEELERLGRG